MIDPKEVEEKVRWYQQFDFKLEAIFGEDYIPGDPEFPDVGKYTIIAYDKEDDAHIFITWEDEESRQFYDAVIKRLKQIKGIKDPWDDDPDYVRRKLAEEEAEVEKKE